MGWRDGMIKSPSPGSIEKYVTGKGCHETVIAVATAVTAGSNLIDRLADIDKTVDMGEERKVA